MISRPIVEVVEGFAGMESVRLYDNAGLGCEAPEQWLDLVCSAELRSEGAQSRIARDGPGARVGIYRECQAGFRQLGWTKDGSAAIPLGIIAWLWIAHPELAPVIVRARYVVMPQLEETVRAWVRSACLDLARPTVEPKAEDIAGVASPPLRDYQAGMAEMAFGAPFGRSILYAGCGAGKTWVAAGVMACGRAMLGGRWLYLAPNTELASQTSRVFTEAAMPALRAHIAAGPKRLLGGHGESLNGDTWWRCRSLGEAEQEHGTPLMGIVIDESQRLGALSRLRVVSRLRARMWTGLSATPLCRQDSRNMLAVAAMGPILRYEGSGVPMLTSNGHLSSAYVVGG